MSAPPLSGSSLAHAFGERRVLGGVELALEPGRLLVVVGPNAAGKTTLLRILAGTLEPDAGEVALHGRPLRSYRRREVARALAVVPQELAVPFPFRVRDMVAMGRAPHLGPFGSEGPRDRERIEAALASLGISELVGRAFPTLSGGEKQRVLLARALAQDTDLLLLDEPTAHMDLGHRVHTFEWLREWLGASGRSRTALLVTHDLILGARFADRVLLLDAGRVAAHGDPREVLTPERIAEVYGVEASVSVDRDGRPVIVAHRSRIHYPRRHDAPPP